MNKIANVILKPLQQSIYLKPYTVEYTENKVKKVVNCAAQHDSVAILIYNTTRKVLVMVKQFRPPIYAADIPEEELGDIDTTKYPGDRGITLELCAGIVDKKLSLEQIAKEEVLEECGYDVPLSSLEFVLQYNAMGANLTTYYCEVTDEMKVTDGGGIDDEMIDVVEMSVPEIEKYVTQNEVRSPPSFMYCIYWFLYNKVK